MHKQLVYLTSVTAAAFLLSLGCGAPPDSDPVVGEAEALTVGRGLAATVEGIVDYYNYDFEIGASSGRHLINRMSPIPQRPGGDHGCVTFEGDASDADLDGIPLNVLATFDCYGKDGDATASLTGFEHVKDTRPTQAAFDFQLGVDLAFEAESPTASAFATERGLVIGAENGPLYVLDAARHVQAAFSNENESHELEAYEELRASLSLATLDVAINGAWAVTADDAYAASYVATVPFVHVNPMCQTESQIDSGAVQAAWTDGSEAAVVRVEWLACGRVRITFNGVILEDDKV